MAKLTERARELRRQQTDAEGIFWSRVRNRRLAGWKFKRQVPMGNYVVDFLCEEAKLIVELDGSQHSEQTAREYDARRTAWLEKQGYDVLRFWNEDVFKHLDSVLERTRDYLEASKHL